MPSSVIRDLVRQNATGFFFLRPILTEVTDNETFSRIWAKAMQVHEESCRKVGATYQPVFTFEDMSHLMPAPARMWICRKDATGWLQQMGYVDLEVVRDKTGAFYIFDLAVVLDWRQATQAELPIEA